MLAQFCSVVKRYYETDFANKIKQAPWDIKSNIPTMPSSYRRSSSTNSSSSVDGEVSIMASYWDVASDQGMWGPYFFQSFLGFVDTYAPWIEDLTAGFFTLKRGSNAEDTLTAGNLLHDMLVCDFDSVMFCGRQGYSDGGGRVRRNIFVCAIVAYVLWYAVGLMISTVPGAGVLYVMVYSFMWVLVPITAVQLSYGMAATCFPMLPTCLLQVG
jgi:hypothetical protein